MAVGAGDAIPEGFDGGDTIVFEHNDEGEYVPVQSSDAGLDGFETLLSLQDVPEPYREEDPDPNEGNLDGDDLEDEDVLDDEPDEDLDEEDPEPEQQAKPQTRVQKRIKKAIDQRDAALRRMEELQSNYEQQLHAVMQQQQHTYNAQLQAAQEQNQILAEQLRILVDGRQSEQRENLPEIERFKLDLEERALKRAKKALDPEVQSVRQELAQLKQERQQDRERREQAQRFRSYDMDADAVLQAGYSHVTDPQQKQILKDLLISTAAAYGKLPSQVSHVFDRAVTAFGVERKGKTKRKNPAVKARQQLPRSVRTKGGAQPTQGQGNPRPSWAALEASEFRDLHEWRNAGAPLLPEP